jgi:hypothetical protein
MDIDVLNEISDILNHKKFIMDSGYKMCKYLFDNGKDDMAFELLERIVIHDNSKIEKNELYLLNSIKDKRSLVDPNILLSCQQKQIIESHWKNNRHHPEYFENISDMLDIDIIEMCCDWNARSLQCGTDLIKFVEIRQEKRFKFPENIYEKIIEYCNILLQ